MTQLLSSTARPAAGSALTLAEERARLALGLLDAIRDGVFILDPETLRFSYVNQGAVRQTGYSRDELLAMTLLDIEPLADEAPFRQMIASLRAGDVAEGMFETAHRRKDGGDVPVEILQFIPAEGQGSRCIAIVRDITERKRADRRRERFSTLAHDRRAVEKRNLHLQTQRTDEALKTQARLLDLAHDAIIVRDFATRQITFWNQGAERLYGWTRAEALGKSVSELLFRDPDAVDAVSEELLATGKWRGELKQVNRDNGDVFVMGSATLVRDGQGHPSAVLTINTDITEMKTIEAQFLRAQRLEGIGTLASGVAHDLNNILAPILMVVPILQEALAGTRHERMISTLETCAQRGADVVRQVLTFARGVEGERVLLQTGHLVREMEKIARETFPRAITVRNCAPHDLWPVTGDATQLHQVLLNLCVNARDAMPEGGTLTLDAENFDLDTHYASMVPGAQAGPHLLLKITDTGTGIPRGVMDKIFDPFFTTKALGKGSGLGLSTVMGIARSHGGFVNVTSEAGRGTTFEVFLPASPDAEPAAAADDAGPVPQGHGELILVTDDEAAIRDVMCAVLEKNGYQTLAAADGAEAIALYAQRRAEIGAVVTDLMMPHLDGLALSRALTRMNPEVPIIACTGLSEESRSAELRALGVRGFLAKPHTAERLLRTLHEALEPGAVPALAA